MDNKETLNCYENNPKIHKRTMSSSTEKIKNRVVYFVDTDIQHANFNPWPVPDSEEERKGKLKGDLDILLINNNEWKSLYSEKIKTPESFRKKRVTDFRVLKSRTKNIKCNIKTEISSPKPNYAVNVYALCEVLKKVKSDEEKIVNKNSSPKLIDSKILGNIKRSMTKKEKLNAESRSKTLQKCSEFEENDKKIKSKTTGKFSQNKPDTVIKIEQKEEQSSDHIKNKLFLQEVLGILTENEKEKSAEESKISQNFLSSKDNCPDLSERNKNFTTYSYNKLSYQYEQKIKEKENLKIGYPPSNNKAEKEIDIVSQNNNSFRDDDITKSLNKASSKNPKITKKKKSLSMRSINDINSTNKLKLQVKNKAWEKKFSIKNSKTERICDNPHDFRPTLRIHSLSTPSSIIENSPQCNPIFSPRIRPHSVIFQNFSGKIENQSKNEAPFCVSVRGTKVKECDSYGIMFRPSTACVKKSSIPISSIAIKRAIYSHKLK